MYLKINRIGKWSRGSPAVHEQYSAPRLPEHSSVSHNVMNSNRSHTVIQCA